MGESILIVEDNLDNLKLVKTILSRANYDVRIARDAYAAINILSTFQPHLILMDMKLPGTDGFDLTRKLKADPKYKNIIIVALTAYAMKGDEERTKAAGCDGYIAKPIDLNTFPSIIAKYLQEKI